MRPGVRGGVEALRRGRPAAARRFGLDGRHAVLGAGPRRAGRGRQPGEKKDWHIEFRSGGPARFSIHGRDHTNVELRVFEAGTEQLVAGSTEGSTDQRDVTWLPPFNRLYRVEVWNRDPQGCNDVKM